MKTLPPPPAVRIAKVDERVDRGGFLALHQATVRVGELPPASYDFVSRASLDSSVIAAHYREGDERFVFLRSAVRPPLALRGLEASHWELPAGLIDEEESEVAAARRELEEELGFSVPLSAIQRLGGSVFPAPAVVAEIQHFFHVEVTPSRRTEPRGDGSPFESTFAIEAVSFSRIRDLVRSGAFRDAKTELGLRRLLELA